MKKHLLKFLSILTIVVVVISTVAFAASDVKLQLYFYPHTMNDATGEILVDVMIKNFNLAVSDSYGDICGVTFEFEYNDEQFEIMKNESGDVEILIDENALVKSKTDIECEIAEESGRVVYSFMDSSLSKNLIGQDGKLFSFTLVAKNVGEFWNSAEKYPLRFVADSIGFVMYDLPRHRVSRLYNVEGIDINVGAYNNPPTLIPQSVDKCLTFTAGKTEVDVDGTVSETDAAPFMKDDVLMIPVRYFCESIGMAVEWKEGIMTAGAYAEYKALAISIKEEIPRVYINSVISNTSVQPVEKDGRIYIPCDLALKLYRDAQVEQTGDSVTIYIP